MPTARRPSPLRAWRSVPLLLAGGLLACAARPIVYPAGPYEVGEEEMIQRDIEVCLGRAHAALAEGRAGEIAKDAGENAVVGGATGAAVGGALGRSAGRGAAAGAAGAATHTVMRGLIKQRPPPLERRYTEMCLRDMGYRILGWR